jgi:hypothetical protein
MNINLIYPGDKREVVPGVLQPMNPPAEAATAKAVVAEPQQNRRVPVTSQVSTTSGAASPYTAPQYSPLTNEAVLEALRTKPRERTAILDRNGNIKYVN